MVVKVKLSKGGPRVSLYESCKKLQWPMPTFEFVKVEPRYYCFTLGLQLACVNKYLIFPLLKISVCALPVIPHKRLHPKDSHLLQQ